MSFGPANELEVSLCVPPHQVPSHGQTLATAHYSPGCRDPSGLYASGVSHLCLSLVACCVYPVGGELGDYNILCCPRCYGMYRGSLRMPHFQIMAWQNFLGEISPRV